MQKSVLTLAKFAYQRNFFGKLYMYYFKLFLTAMNGIESEMIWQTMVKKPSKNVSDHS